MIDLKESKKLIFFITENEKVDSLKKFISDRVKDNEEFALYSDIIKQMKNYFINNRDYKKTKIPQETQYYVNVVDKKTKTDEIVFIQIFFIPFFFKEETSIHLIKKYKKEKINGNKPEPKCVLISQFINKKIDTKSIPTNYVENLKEKIKNITVNNQAKESSNHSDFNNSEYNKDNIFLISFKEELEIIKKIIVHINNIKEYKTKKIIYSDMEIGIIDEELRYIDIGTNLIPQIVKSKSKKQLFSLINSFIKIKIDSKYLKLISKLKDNDIFSMEIKEIYFKIEKIKTLTSFRKEKAFIKKNILKSFLLSNSKHLYKSNVKLFKILELWIKNTPNLNLFKTKIKYINLVTFWENYCYSYIHKNLKEVQENKKLFEWDKENYQLIKQSDKSNTQIKFVKEVYLIEENKEPNCILNTTIISKPDLILSSKCRTIVIDAKYKIIETDDYGNIKLKNLSADINKLLRDMSINKTNEGYLILVKAETEEIGISKYELEFNEDYKIITNKNEKGETAKVNIYVIPFIQSILINK